MYFGMNRLISLSLTSEMMDKIYVKHQPHLLSKDSPSLVKKDRQELLSTHVNRVYVLLDVHVLHVPALVKLRLIQQDVVVPAASLMVGEQFYSLMWPEMMYPQR